MDFYSSAGQMALGSRLRQLADTITSDAQKLYELYGANIDARWFPVFYMLTVKKEAAITELAQDIGQSHPAVSQVVKNMLKEKIVQAKKCAKDARVSRISLTEKGREISKKVALQCADVNEAVEDLLRSSAENLWADIEAVEHKLEQNSLYNRVTAIRKIRESSKAELVPYRSKYKEAFKNLNENWITRYWELEPSDHKALDNPQKNIIGRGGYIAMAELDGETVGTCALLKMDNDCYELAKMAVSDSAKGKGIGFLLGKHVIEKAVELGAKRVYLESNTLLEPALSLYRKLGFKMVSGETSPYDRCDVQMEILLP